MVSTDPVADMLSRLRNASSVGKNEVILPYSGLKERIAKLLASKGFVNDVKVSGDKVAKALTVTIADDQTGHRITALKRLSRPGQRRYVKAAEIPVVKRGRGIVVVSTSQGLMTGEEAKAKNLGGELICEVY